MRCQRGPRTGRIALGVTAVFACLAVAGPAQASTQIKIREVAPGLTEYTDNAEFVELQLIADDQGDVGGKVIRFYAPSGSQSGSVTLPSGVSESGNQRTILIGTSDVATDFGVTPDFTYANAALESGGGAVCYGQIDCVSWGDYVGEYSNGQAAPAIPEGQSLTRTIARGCATALDTADDTDSNSADFAVTAAPSPRANATVPSETLCGGGGGGGGDTTAPQTAITKAPRKAVKTKKRKAKVTFGFRSSETRSTFECRLDGGQWTSCASPFKLKVKRGKHTFEVAATDRAGNVDPTPASHSFKVKKKKRKKRK
jgi:hypothetical protein